MFILFCLFISFSYKFTIKSVSQTQSDFSEIRVVKNGGTSLNLQKGEDKIEVYTHDCLPVRETDCVYLRITTTGSPADGNVVLYFGGVKIHEETRHFRSNQRETFLVVQRRYMEVKESKLCTGINNNCKNGKNLFFI